MPTHSITTSRPLHCIKTVSLPLISVALLLISPAMARFDLLPVVDEYRVLADTWQVQMAEDKPMQNSLSIIVRHHNKSYKWPIQFRYVSDAFSEGKVDDDEAAEKFVLQHIKVTEASKEKGPLVIKIASFEKGGDLFVRSFKIFDVEDSFKTARKYGSPMLEMDANEIQKMDLKAYRKKIIEVTNKDWAQIEHR